MFGEKGIQPNLFSNQTKKEGYMVLILMVITILAMIILCYVTSGLALTAGSIFERKTTVSKSSKK